MTINYLEDFTITLNCDFVKSGDSVTVKMYTSNNQNVIYEASSSNGQCAVYDGKIIITTNNHGLTDGVLHLSVTTPTTSDYIVNTGYLLVKGQGVARAIDTGDSSALESLILENTARIDNLTVEVEQVDSKIRKADLYRLDDINFDGNHLFWRNSDTPREVVNGKVNIDTSLIDESIMFKFANKNNYTTSGGKEVFTAYATEFPSSVLEIGSRVLGDKGFINRIDADERYVRVDDADELYVKLEDYEEVINYTFANQYNYYRLNSYISLKDGLSLNDNVYSTGSITVKPYHSDGFAFVHLGSSAYLNKASRVHASSVYVGSYMNSRFNLYIAEGLDIHELEVRFLPEFASSEIQKKYIQENGITYSGEDKIILRVVIKNKGYYDFDISRLQITQCVDTYGKLDSYILKFKTDEKNTSFYFLDIVTAAPLYNDGGTITGGGCHYFEVNAMKTSAFDLDDVIEFPTYIEDANEIFSK